MASISGIQGGMVPVDRNSDKAIHKKPREFTAVEFECVCCQHVTTIRNKRTAKETDRESFKCAGCMSMFRPNMWTFGNELDYDDTMEKLSKLDDNSWVFAKYANKFHCTVTGRDMHVLPGDAFKVVRIGLSFKNDGSISGSIKKFTIDVQFGSQVLTLFAHEFYPISWTTLVSANTAGEMTYKFLEQSDAWGVYEPANDEIRDTLNNMLALTR